MSGLDWSCNEGFPQWLLDHTCALAFTSYRDGGVHLVSGIFDQETDKPLTIRVRTLDRPMGLTASGNRLWVSSRFSLYRWDQMLGPGQLHPDGYDGVFLPRSQHFTGAVDIHDLHLSAQGVPTVAATAMNAVAQLDNHYTLAPIWKPSFIDAYALGDKCHLNGLAMHRGRPSVVSIVGPSHHVEGWREHRLDGGQLIGLGKDQILLEGLSMPHSPRWHQGPQDSDLRLYFLNSGHGQLCRWSGTGAPEVICSLPGFARGLEFIDNYALITTSKADPGRFANMPMLGRIPDGGTCGIHLINLSTGKLEHSLIIHALRNGDQEVFDLTVLSGITRPYMVGVMDEELPNAHVWPN